MHSKEVRELKDKVEELRKKEADAAKAKEDKLDNALEDTFPASDPVSPVSKGTPSTPKRRTTNG